MSYKTHGTIQDAKKKHGASGVHYELMPVVKKGKTRWFRHNNVSPIMKYFAIKMNVWGLVHFAHNGEAE